MALVGTISGSNGTSNTAITGTLVIANTTDNFPNITPDAVLFVSGAIGGDSKSVFGGDLVVSGNADIKGDIAVVGGDLTSTAATFNIANSGVSTINFGGGAAAVNIGAAASVTALAGDLNIGGGGLKARFGPAQNLTILHNTNAAIANTSGQLLIQQNTVNQRLELQTSGSLGSGMFRVRNIPGTGGVRDLIEVRNDGTILIGSASTGATFLGSTTISNDLFLSSGRIAVNTDTTAIELVSSGNVTVKLDANNNAAGHFFAVQNFAGTNQLLVNENGNVDVSGSLVVSGSVLATVTTTTFNLLNTTLTGTLNIGGATQIVNIGGITSTGSFPGELRSDGNFNVGLVSERLFNSSSAGGTMSFNVGAQTIFYVNNPTSDITANFTSVPVTNLRVITPTVILSQSATPRNVTAVQIDGVGQPINWAGGSSPTVTANRQEVFGFSLIRSGSAWKVLGQMTSYG